MSLVELRKCDQCSRTIERRSAVGWRRVTTLSATSGWEVCSKGCYIAIADQLFENQIRRGESL